MRTVAVHGALTILLATGSVSLPAQGNLPPVKDLPQTVGSESQDKSRGPYMFCAVPDAGPVSSAYADAIKGGRHPFVVGWELRVDPPRRLAKILLVTNLSQTGSLAKMDCQRVESLPKGGVDAMQLFKPYNIVDRTTDWGSGSVSQVMTEKLDSIASADYVSRLKRHVKLVTEIFEPQGLDGYIVYAGDDFEWGYLHFPDQQTRDKAFATPIGKTGPADSASFQKGRGPSVQIFPGVLAGR